MKTELVECGACHGNGYVRGICGQLRCGECHGAGVVEVYVEAPDEAEAEGTPQ